MFSRRVFLFRDRVVRSLRLPIIRKPVFRFTRVTMQSGEPLPGTVSISQCPRGVRKYDAFRPCGPDYHYYHMKRGIQEAQEKKY